MDSAAARERVQMEQILELDLEELLVEEVDRLDDSSDDDDDHRRPLASGTSGFNTCLPSLHTYLGEVEETRHRVSFLDGGAIFNLPIFYLEGVVLFPEATLPLRVVEPNFIVAVERALMQVDAPYTVGVLRAHRNAANGKTKLSTVGTTAEIRQYRRLEDGSLNVVTRGQQRFRLRRNWIDVEGVPCGEVQIIQEDLPLRTPQDACRDLALPSNASGAKVRDLNDGSDESYEGSLSLSERTIHRAAIGFGESTTSSDDDDKLEPENGAGNVSVSQSCSGAYWRNNNINQPRRVSKAFWPFWVYRMYDSYHLAQRAADLWKQIIGAPSMEGVVKKPDILSFYIASKIPVSESTRQELLEIDGISYRLRREIELLESMDLIRCRVCQSVISRRSDILVMSSEGPLSAYVNPHGFVHEVLSLYRANGLALRGPAETDYSWFPGYAWTMTDCATCESSMGWLFTATNDKLKPNFFWGIRTSQVSDNTH